MTIANATPLVALDALVLDTETTGLDPAKAHIIEWGSVRLAGNKVDRTSERRLLVKPPVAVPPQSTAIHGIDDRALVDAPAFGDLSSDIAAELTDQVVIGHSIGFDLAMLANEFRRAGREWTPPRALCTRMLAEVAERSLPGYSLEEVAAWLGVKPQGRHSAVGDAVTAAEIFIALLPRLRERGIRTLAEAEHAVRQLSHVLDEHHRAGWTMPAEKAGARDDARLQRTDLYPYRNRIDALMHTPVFVADDLSLGQALDRMIRERISSLLVIGGADTSSRLPENVGILTERDVLRAVAAQGADALARPAGPLTSRPLQVVSSDAFVYRAIARMRRLHIRHLGVIDAKGEVCGVVSARDLLRLRADAALWLGEEIDEAEDAATLARAWARVPQVVAALRSEGVSGLDVAALVSDELCALTARAAFIVERQMETEGAGPAPCAFAVAVLGSAGRGESLLALDQDNALIYARDGDDAEKWFAAFGQRFADLLNEIGVPYCKGGIMTSNPQWRGSLETWQQRVAAWLRTSNPQSLLSVDIFFDLRGVYGAVELADTLWRSAFEQAGRDAGFAKLLAESAGTVAPAIGVFGRIRTDNGRLDLKKTALFGIVTAARILAIRHRVVARSTPARLDGLRAMQPHDAHDLESMREAQGVLLDLIADQQVLDISAGLQPSNTVVMKRLSARQQDRLRSILGLAGSLDEVTRTLLFRE